MTKWSNIRDAFLRSLRTKSGQGAKKFYIYSEHLQFLLKISQKDETDCNFRQTETEHDSTAVEEFAESRLPDARSPCSPKSQPVPSTSRTTSKSKRHLDDLEREILCELKKGRQSIDSGNASHSHRSDQEMILLSFLPYIRDMSETELMDFQMEVLTTIKTIKQRRVSNQQHVNVPLTSPTMSHSDSYQSSLHTFDYQSSPSSYQMENQSTQPPQRLTFNKYQQLFNDTV